VSALARDTGWEVVAGEWSAGEQQALDRRVAVKYTQETWNAKR